MKFDTLAALAADESASAMVEYGIVLATFSAAVTALLITIATGANTALLNASSSMQTFQAAPPP